jgi:hypothetical protein
MANYITVKNSSQTSFIHCAISASPLGVQQDFRNDLKPNGGYGEFALSDLGWHDLTIVIGGTDNKFKTANNNKVDIGRMLLQMAPVAMVVPGIGTLVAVVGTAVAVGLDQSGTKSIYTPSIGSDGPGTGAKTFVLGEGVKLHAPSLTIPGLYTPYGNDIEVTGGDLIIDSRSDGPDIIKGITPLKAHWKNRTTKASANYVAGH